MDKLTCLVIAGSYYDIDLLKDDTLIDSLQEAFGTECVVFASTQEELEQRCANCSSVFALLYFNSFPASYEAFMNWALPIPNIRQVYRASFDGLRVWVYNKNVVVNCVTKEELPAAIRNSLSTETTLQRYASPVAFVIGVILLSITLLHSYGLNKKQTNNSSSKNFDITANEVLQN